MPFCLVLFSPGLEQLLPPGCGFYHPRVSAAGELFKRQTEQNLGEVRMPCKVICVHLEICLDLGCCLWPLNVSKEKSQTSYCSYLSKRATVDPVLSGSVLRGSLLSGPLSICPLLSGPLLRGPLSVKWPSIKRPSFTWPSQC